MVYVMYVQLNIQGGETFPKFWVWKKCYCYQSVFWWHGHRRVAIHHINAWCKWEKGPEVITARGQSLNPTSCSIQKAGHSPYLGNTIWPTLLAEVWKREPHTFKCRRIVPLYVMWCWKFPLIPCSYCLQQITELTLPLINRSIHKSRHCS